MKLVRVHLYIYGHVQGVFFRSTMRKIAESLGLTGWVRNLRDGRVEAVVEGEEEKVERLIAWCHRGPPTAYVTKVEVTREPYKGEFKDFTIQWGRFP
ncbi:acylphosphatase [Candidatus Bathyarchaeota archaeon]|nr:acylphosphatase [Candidatus Bathyarchaeota archaeon]